MRLPGVRASHFSGTSRHGFYAEHGGDEDDFESQVALQRLLADKITKYAPLDELRLLLITGAQADGVVTQGLTPLHYACHCDYHAAAKLLLVRGAKVNAVDDAGYAPIHLCAERGNYRLIQLLLEYSARVRWVAPEDEKREYPIRESVDEPLRMAIRHDHYECARLLLERGADANARYFDGPEIVQVSPMDTNFLRLLLSHGADANATARDGLTPLMKACRLREKGIKAVQILLDAGADVNAHAPKKDYRTALHFAVEGGSLELIEFLIKNGACVDMPQDYHGSISPLELAVLKQNPQLITFLLQHCGASLNPPVSNSPFGSPLHIACCSNESRLQSDIVEILLKSGADPNFCPSLDFATVDGNRRRHHLAIKSPMVELLRCQTDVAPPKYEVLALMLSYGGRIILRSPLVDPRGQLRNLLTMLAREPEIAELMMSIAERIQENEDLTTAVRLAYTLQSDVSRERLLAYLRNPRSLLELSRLDIREEMRKTCEGRIRPEMVKGMMLPETQKLYLLGHFY